jgi:hypothetical protein
MTLIGTRYRCAPSKNSGPVYVLRKIPGGSFEQYGRNAQKRIIAGIQKPTPCLTANCKSIMISPSTGNL